MGTSLIRNPTGSWWGTGHRTRGRPCLRGMPGHAPPAYCEVYGFSTSGLSKRSLGTPLRGKDLPLSKGDAGNVFSPPRLAVEAAVGILTLNAKPSAPNPQP